VAIETVPLGEAQLEQAAALRAARGRAILAGEPSLPARLAEVDAARAEIGAALAGGHADGVAALRGGQLAGYLIGVLTFTDPLSARAMADPPRAGWIVSHAVATEDGAELYRHLYAALAARWVAQGSFAHFTDAYACEGEAVEAWFSLGFGQLALHALRDTSAPHTRPATDVRIHRAGAEDVEAVYQLEQGLSRYESQAPMFRPYLAETEPDQRRRTTELLASSQNAVWLAERDGRTVGMFSFAPPWPQLPTPIGCIWLRDGFAEPGERGRGVGTALLAQGMAWAHEEGYRWCMLNFLAPNLIGRRFWLGNGFRPVRFFLGRYLDPRIAWARGEALA
jgi:GNAT superfamily N-acetyltransferase